MAGDVRQRGQISDFFFFRPEPSWDPPQLALLFRLPVDSTVGSGPAVSIGDGAIIDKRLMITDR